MANFGKAEYVIGRNRKNPILVYTSRTNRSRVYEFMVASKFRVSGLVSWKCVSCLKIKNDYRNLGEKLDRVVPLILVDNDLIKEDPEKPLNGDHFCSGKDAIDAVIYRAKLNFIAKHEDTNTEISKIQDTIDDFSKKAVESTPVPLTLKEKRLVKKTLDVRCFSLLKDVQKRKNRKQFLNNYVNAEGQDVVGPSTSSAATSEIVEIRENEDEIEDADIYEYERFQVKETNGERTYSETNVKNKPPGFYYRQASAVSRSPDETPTKKVKLETSPDLDVCNNEDIILGDTQDVAYDIELA